MPKYTKIRRAIVKKQKALPKKKKRTANSASKSIVAHGIRTLSSFIPGQTIIRPAVDFILKTFGLSKFYLNDDNKVNAVVTLTGASSCIPFYTGDFFSSMDVYGMPELAQVNPVPVSNSAVSAVTVMGTKINHKSVKLNYVTWRLSPTGELGKRSGMWAMAWQPNYTYKEDSAFNLRSLITRPPTFDNVREMAYSTWGPASRGLTLTWRPKLQRDGYSALPREMGGIGVTAAAGWLYLCYEDQNRPSTSKFDINELSAEVVVRATGTFSVKEMNSMTDVGGQVLVPTMYEAKEVGILVFDGHKTYDLIAEYDGNTVRGILPETHPEYDIIRTKLAEEKMRLMEI